MTSLMAVAPTHAGSVIFDRILEANSGLVLLSGADVHVLTSQLRMISRHTGQAVYLWQPDSGLGSLRDACARVPDCQRLGNALRFMQQSMHFGVYVLAGIELPLSAADAAALGQLARAPTEYLRRVVVLDPPPALVEHLGALAVRLDWEPRQPRGLRLRDGRWLA